MSSALLSPGDDWGNRLHEERMAKWRPASSYNVPQGLPQSEPKALVGRWQHGMGGASLTIQNLSLGRLHVHFSTSGCLGAWSAERTATLEGGVLRLNRGIEPYGGVTCDRFFVMKRNGTIQLIPAGAQEEARELGGNKAESIEHWIDNLSYSKAAATKQEG